MHPAAVEQGSQT